MDELTNQKFLVDTGVAYYVILFVSKHSLNGQAICMADKSLIPCWGWTTCDISAGSQRFTGTFMKAKVAFLILGADFLQSFDLLVDLQRGRLFCHGGHPLQLNVVRSVYVNSGIMRANLLDPGKNSSTSVDALENVEALEETAVQVLSVALATQVNCDLQQQLEKEFSTVLNRQSSSLQ